MDILPYPVVGGRQPHLCLEHPLVERGLVVGHRCPSILDRLLSIIVYTISGLGSAKIGLISCISRPCQTSKFSSSSDQM